MEKNYKDLLQSDTSSWQADKAVRKYYQHAERLIDTPVWFDRMGLKQDADTVFSVLCKELIANGLDTTAFYIPQLRQDIELVHSLAFDSLGQDINQVLPRLDFLLSKAFVRFTVGQRYGFMRPARVFNHLDEKPDLDQHLPWLKETKPKKKKLEEEKEYLRLFDYDVKKPDY
ncbi:MAG: hypothetical protein K5683_10845, partial [Prevotella sp.]|nr:hypothetical protein [Prevotella sp.]